MKKKLKSKLIAQAILCVVAFVLVAISSNGCATSKPRLSGYTIGNHALPLHCTIFKPEAFDPEVYVPTVEEAEEYISLCCGGPDGGCEDYARRCAQKCRDLFNVRTGSSNDIEFGTFCAVGKSESAEPHMTVAILTTDGYRFYNGDSGLDVTDEFEFERFI